MKRARIYLDFNATAPLRPQARAALIGALDGVANASSVHAEGRAARRLIETARASVAMLVGARPAGVTFTAGASEANVMALSPVWRDGTSQIRFSRLLVGATEHASVRAGGRFAADQVEVLPVDADGLIERETLAARLAQAPGPCLVAIQWANNETGVIQPIAEWAAMARAAGARIHCDAVQAVGRVPVSIGLAGIDTLAISAHKLGGPLGAGALVAADTNVGPPALVAGGGQERNLRAGTENTPALAGFGVAADAAAMELGEWEPICRLRDWLEAQLKTICSEAIVFGAAATRLPNTVQFAFPGISAETALIRLDLDGVAVSSGSACSSGKVGVSSVLSAMGVAPEVARCGIRVSLGLATTAEELERLCAALAALVSTVRGKAGGSRHHAA